VRFSGEAGGVRVPPPPGGFTVRLPLPPWPVLPPPPTEEECPRRGWGWPDGDGVSDRREKSAKKISLELGVFGRRWSLPFWFAINVVV
jgi:hypothetical protein